MSDILLITPPDKIFNQNKSILLIYPTEAAKNSVQNYLAETELTLNVYIYDKLADESQEIDWLLSIAKQSEFVFIDIDNCESAVRDLASYFVSFVNCYWLTQSENIIYNRLSSNRIYDTDSIKFVIGDKIEI